MADKTIRFAIRLSRSAARSAGALPGHVDGIELAWTAGADAPRPADADELSAESTARAMRAAAGGGAAVDTSGAVGTGVSLGGLAASGEHVGGDDATTPAGDFTPDRRTIDLSSSNIVGLRVTRGWTGRSREDAELCSELAAACEQNPGCYVRLPAPTPHRRTGTRELITRYAGWLTGQAKSCARTGNRLIQDAGGPLDRSADVWTLAEMVPGGSLAIAWPADASPDPPAVVVPMLHHRLAAIDLRSADATAVEWVHRLLGIGSAAWIVACPEVSAPPVAGVAASASTPDDIRGVLLVEQLRELALRPTHKGKVHSVAVPSGK